MSTYRVSDSVETVGARIDSGELVATKATISDLWTAIEWLSMYEGSEDDGNVPAFANALVFIQQEINRRENATAVAAAKRAYAAEHGIPVRNVRIAR